MKCGESREDGHLRGGEREKQSLKWEMGGQVVAPRFTAARRYSALGGPRANRRVSAILNPPPPEKGEIECLLSAEQRERFKDLFISALGPNCEDLEGASIACSTAVELMAAHRMPANMMDRALALVGAFEESGSFVSLPAFQVLMALVEHVTFNQLPLPETLPDKLAAACSNGSAGLVREDQDDDDGSSRTPSLKYIDLMHPDAVYASTVHARQKMNDVRSHFHMLSSLDAVSERDRSRVALPVEKVARSAPRRHTLNLLASVKEGEGSNSIVGSFDAASKSSGGRRKGPSGQRMSLITTAYEPAARALHQRTLAAAEVERKLKDDVENALRRWELPLSILDTSQDSREAGDDPVLSVANFSGMALHDDDFLALGYLLDHNASFSVLDLSGAFLSESNALLLVKALAFNTVVEELHLRNCYLPTAAVDMIAEMMRVNRKLSLVDTRGCVGLDRRGVESLVRAAQCNSNIKLLNGLDLVALAEACSFPDLELSGWGLGYLETVVVSHYMRASLQGRGYGLSSLNLAHNFLTDDCFDVLMEVLEGERQLTSLRLPHNLLDERIVWALETLLQNNTKLESIDLSNNCLSCSRFEERGLLLLRLLTAHTQVLQLSLEGNEIGPSLESSIAMKLSVNAVMAQEGTRTLGTVVDARLTNAHVEAIVAPKESVAVLQHVDTHFMKKLSLPATSAEVGGGVGGYALVRSCCW